jgi:hypothetical protein
MGIPADPPTLILEMIGYEERNVYDREIKDWLFVAIASGVAAWT